MSRNFGIMHDSSGVIWKCPNCSMKPVEIDLFPVYCACGYVGYEDGTGKYPDAKKGVGTILTRKLKLAKYMGRLIFFWRGCSCASRAAVMDSAGIDWCKKNRETIIDWLLESPLAKIVPDAAQRAEILLEDSIKEAERASTPTNPTP